MKQRTKAKLNTLWDFNSVKISEYAYKWIYLARTQAKLRTYKIFFQKMRLLFILLARID